MLGKGDRRLFARPVYEGERGPQPHQRPGKSPCFRRRLWRCRLSGPQICLPRGSVTSAPQPAEAVAEARNRRRGSCDEWRRPPDSPGQTPSATSHRPAAPARTASPLAPLRSTGCRPRPVHPLDAHGGEDRAPLLHAEPAIPRRARYSTPRLSIRRVLPSQAAARMRAARSGASPSGGCHGTRVSGSQTAR